MHRPLAGGVDVWVTIVQLEAVPGAIGKQDTGVSGDDPGPKLAETVKMSEIISPSASMTQSEVVSPAAITPASIVDAYRESIVANRSAAHSFDRSVASGVST